jgi:hypothetical protein
MTLPPPTATRRSAAAVDGPAGGVLPDAGEGSGVPVAEQGFHAPDEVGLLVEAASGNDEGPIVRPGLLF